MSLDFAQNQRRILTAQSKTIGQHIAQVFEVTGDIRRVIKVTFRVWRIVVDGGVNPLMYQRQRTDNGLKRASRAKSMTNHALG